MVPALDQAPPRFNAPLPAMLMAPSFVQDPASVTLPPLTPWIVPLFVQLVPLMARVPAALAEIVP